MNLKAFRTVLGGVLIELSLGSLYTAANMITYIISYIHVIVGNTVSLAPVFLIDRVLPIRCQLGCSLLALWARPAL